MYITSFWATNILRLTGRHLSNFGARYHNDMPTAWLHYLCMPRHASNQTSGQREVMYSAVGGIIHEKSIIQQAGASRGENHFGDVNAKYVQVVYQRTGTVTASVLGGVTQISGIRSPSPERMVKGSVGVGVGRWLVFFCIGYGDVRGRSKDEAHFNGAGSIPKNPKSITSLPAKAGRDNSFRKYISSSSRLFSIASPLSLVRRNQDIFLGGNSGSSS